jgi:hypothetical protein
MSIAELRAEFKQLSGLIALSDTECDKWINRGIRHLDLISNFQHSEARQAQLIVAGQYQVDFQRTCRVIHDIYAIDLTGYTDPSTSLQREVGRGKVMLNMSHDNFLTNHPDLANEDRSRPLEAASVVIIGVNALSIPGGIPTYDRFVETKSSAFTNSTYDIRGLLLSPPADKEYMLEVYGKWFSPNLSDTVQENAWSLGHSDTVIAAALYKLNLIKYRNTEGAKDYMGAIMSTLIGLDYDIAEEESNQVPRMEG